MGNWHWYDIANIVFMLAVTAGFYAYRAKQRHG